MPVYDYVCRSCKKKFEVLKKFSDTSPVTCPKCGSNEAERQFGTFSIPETPGLSKTPRGKAPWEYT